MKIYETTPKLLIRIQILRKQEEREYLTLEETTFAEVETFCKKVIQKQNLNIFAKGYVTSILIREYLGATAKKQKSISFRGLSAKETFDLIIQHIKAIEQ